MVSDLEYSFYILTMSQLAAGNYPSQGILFILTPRNWAPKLFSETPEAPGLSIVFSRVMGASLPLGSSALMVD